MATRKKRFPCGHSGKGAFCHCCRQQKTATNAPELHRPRRIERVGPGFSVPDPLQQWEKKILQLPYPSLQRKAAKILLAVLIEGKPYTEYLGKRFTYDRSVISVPLGFSWRMLIRELPDKSKTLLSILSHERYNNRKPGT